MIGTICRMQCSQSKIVRFLNASPMLHVGPNEFKTVSLVPVDYTVEKQLGNMFNTINVMVSGYLKAYIELVHHGYPHKS